MQTTDTHKSLEIKIIVSFIVSTDICCCLKHQPLSVVVCICLLSCKMIILWMAWSADCRCHRGLFLYSLEV